MSLSCFGLDINRKLEIYQHISGGTGIIKMTMLKSVNLSILQKTINKTSKSPHAFAMCSIRTDLLKQENEKIDSL
jgi:hypothetical protein